MKTFNLSNFMNPAEVSGMGHAEPECADGPQYSCYSRDGFTIYTSKRPVCGSGFTYAEISAYCHDQFNLVQRDRMDEIPAHLDKCTSCYSLEKAIKKLENPSRLTRVIFH